VLSHYPNYAAETCKLKLTISGNLTVLSNGTISADALGYIGQQGPGWKVGAGIEWGAAHGGALKFGLFWFSP
jgi:hypothetical protein